MKCRFLSSVIFVFLSIPQVRFSLALDPREVDWEGRLEVLARNLRTIKMVYWVNVSQNSGASLPGLSRIKSH